ncbi:MAG TPA: phenylacetate--CoA ligase family protein [Rhodospirillales bacterium]|nr:phenylacetate--CoA ligase family protein [Rhodospirillales bacterium]
MLSVEQVFCAACRDPMYKNWLLNRPYPTPGSVEWQCLPSLTGADLKRAAMAGSGDSIRGETFYFSSGSTGHPKLVRIGSDDLRRVNTLCARFSRMEGVGSASRVMVLLPMGLWATGKITVEGHLEAGAQVFPVDLHGGVDAWQRLADEIRPTVISSTPSVLQAWAPHYRGPKLELVETTGEPLLNEARHTIEARFGGFVHDAYGLSECVVGVECAVRSGFHYWPDAVHVEILEPKSDRPVAPGADGEIVLTSFMQEAMPIIRYRSSDRGRILQKPCPCGEDIPRVLFEGRLAETFFMPRGVQVMPDDIREELQGLGSCCRISHESGRETGNTAAVLEIVLFEATPDQAAEARDKLLSGFPDIAELCHENELRLSIFSRELL